MPNTKIVNRRGVAGRLLAALGGGAAAFRASAAAAETGASGTTIPKVAYHLSDLEKVSFVLGNIKNHIEGMGGPEHVHIALVVHGPALNAFRSSAANPDVGHRLKLAQEAGVDLGACGNTLDAQKLSVADLLPGFVRIEEGGVTRLAKLQAEGYAYLRP